MSRSRIFFAKICKNLKSEKNDLEPNSLGLTQKEIEIIQRTWESIPDPEELGQKIFRRIFAKNPRLKASFGLQAVPDENLAQHEKFRSHAQNFANFFALVAENLDRKPKN